jgi:hypothetical protein
MRIQQAQRKRAKIRVAIQGPSGSGKTYSSLLMSYGLCGDWSKICVIDTEHHSADLYAHLGDYNVLPLAKPFTPERYMEAIKTCEAAGAEVIIIDSLSHEWEGEGGILETHAGMQGNSFTNWSKLTPRHNALVQSILASPSHVIATMRTKQEYVLSDKNGKQVPEKVGMKAVSRDGMDYEFTIVLEMDMTHKCICSKDRTGLFVNEPTFKVESSHGQKILKWCEDGSDVIQTILEKLKAANSLDALLNLYNEYPESREQLHERFTNRKNEIMLERAQRNGIAAI